MSSRQPLQTSSARPLQIPVTDSNILVPVLRPLSYPGLHDPHKQLLVLCNPQIIQVVNPWERLSELFLSLPTKATQELFSQAL